MLFRSRPFERLDGAQDTFLADDADGTLQIDGPRCNPNEEYPRRWGARCIVKEGKIVRILDRSRDLLRYFQTGTYTPQRPEV